jgi:hypothetical protein
MKQSFFLIVLVMVASALYGQTPNFIGQWRRLDLYSEKDSLNKQVQRSGDLMISSDSTFTIIGDDSQPASQGSGWHTGGTMKGKWRIRGKNQLDFFIDDVPIPVVYKIRRLNKTELHLRSNFKNSPVLRLRRLQ